MFSNKLDRKVDARADQAAREFAAPAFAKASARQPSLLRHERAELGLPSRSCEAAKAGALAGVEESA